MCRTQPRPCIDARILPKQCLNLNLEGGYCRSAMRYVLEVQWGVAMHAAGLGPTFFEEVYLSLPQSIVFFKVRKYKKKRCWPTSVSRSGVFSTDAN